jgi:hypothetical protein
MIDSEEFRGIAYGVCASRYTFIDGGYYHFDIHRTTDTFKMRKQMRAYRLEQRAKGKRVKTPSSLALGDEIVVLFGPDVSPKDAIEALMRVIENVKREGLDLGKDSKGNDVFEDLKGGIHLWC